MPDRVRGWCFTINNYTEQDCVAIKNLPCRYIIAGLEVGESGTPHIQGYVYFDTPRTLGGTRKKLGGRAHLLQAVASGAANRDYCRKDGNILHEAGEIPDQGARNDLALAYKTMEETGSVRAAVHTAECPSYQLIRAVEVYSNYVPVRKREAPIVHWYWGSTGTGKSYAACEEAGDDAWWSNETLAWFDGYDRHDHVILDDFRVEHISLTMFLRITDRYPLRVPIKGGFRPWTPKKIWITSDRPPERMWYGKDLDQVLRRITLVTEMVQKSEVIVDSDFSNAQPSAVSMGKRPAGAGLE